MKKIYIAGCGGMLGEAFYKQFKTDYILKCTDIDLNEEWLSWLDFRELENYRKDVQEFMPDLLIHLGAYTDLEFCELNVEDTYATNTMAVENAVYIANELNIPLVYISTAGIFDGSKEFFDDYDLPNPLGHYARAKYAGELFVEKYSDKYLVCRAGWMMGGGPKKDKKFVQKMLRQIKEGKKELHVVNDKDGTPTYTHDFAKNVKLLLEKEYWGLYNMVCSGLTSRWEVAQEMVKLIGKEDEIKLIPVTSEYFKKDFFAERPPNERLINRKLNLRGLNIMRDWRTGLAEYIRDYYQGYVD
jgi:dTDP-4-dehydrorhamnose reductase